MTTIKTFLLPDLGEGLTEADLLSWTVAVGDQVELNQVIAEVETAKASVELPCPFAGTVAALHADEGDTIEVGKPFIDVATEEDGADAGSASPVDDVVEPDSDSEAPAERTPVLVGYGVAAEGASRRRRRGITPSASESPGAAAGLDDVGTTTSADDAKPLAAPPVRFAARKHKVDLASVPATGHRGQVTRADLDAYLAGGSAQPTSEAATPATTEPAHVPSPRKIRADEERVPIKGVRKHTAAAMVRSAFTAPHVTEFIDVDVTAAVDLLADLKNHEQMAEVRLTPLALVAKALLVALRTNPSLNSAWDDEAQEIVTKHYVNLGIAAATPRGLMVPNIKDAHTLSLRELAIALAELTTTAKEGKTGPDDLAEGTITITNVGVFGVDAGTPILNPGEAAILCFGSIRRRPWEHHGEIALRSVTTLSLSFDHRLVDGEQGSRFLATMASILSDPLALIALS